MGEIVEMDSKIAERRIADRDRKRADRAAKKAKRDEVDQLAQRRREADAAADDAERRRKERAAMILCELTEPIDESSDVDYWNWFLGELETFLHPFEQLKPFEKSYQHLSASPAGQAVLRYFGVEPLDLTDCIADSGGIHSWTPVPASNDPKESRSPVALSMELIIFYERQLQEKFTKTQQVEVERKRLRRERMKELERQYLGARRLLTERLAVTQ